MDYQLNMEVKQEWQLVRQIRLESNQYSQLDWLFRCIVHLSYILSTRTRTHAPRLHPTLPEDHPGLTSGDLAASWFPSASAPSEPVTWMKLGNVGFYWLGRFLRIQGYNLLTSISSDILWFYCHAWYIYYIIKKNNVLYGCPIDVASANWSTYDFGNWAKIMQPRKILQEMFTTPVHWRCVFAIQFQSWGSDKPLVWSSRRAASPMAVARAPISWNINNFAVGCKKTIISMMVSCIQKLWFSSCGRISAVEKWNDVHIAYACMQRLTRSYTCIQGSFLLVLRSLFFALFSSLFSACASFLASLSFFFSLSFSRFSAAFSFFFSDFSACFLFFLPFFFAFLLFLLLVDSLDPLELSPLELSERLEEDFLRLFPFCLELLESFWEKRDSTITSVSVVSYSSSQQRKRRRSCRSGNSGCNRIWVFLRTSSRSFAFTMADATSSSLYFSANCACVIHLRPPFCFDECTLRILTKKELFVQSSDELHHSSKRMPNFSLLLGPGTW